MAANDWRLGSKTSESAANSTDTLTLFFSMPSTDAAIALMDFSVSALAGKLPSMAKNTT